MRLATFALLCILTAHPALAQSFSCRIGTRPACLDFGDTICSSRGKCVDANAACFDEFQCNFRGFTCRSNLDDCMDEYNGLLQTHNELVDDYNRLARTSRALADELSALSSDFDDLTFCLSRASTIEQARRCIP